MRAEVDARGCVRQEMRMRILGMQRCGNGGMRPTRDVHACDEGCGCACVRATVGAWGCVRRGMRPTKRMRDLPGGPENVDVRM